MTEHNTRDELETRMAEQTAELRTSREQEIELRQILDLVPHLIAVYGPNRERLYANRVFLDYVSFGAGVYVGGRNSGSEVGVSGFFALWKDADPDVPILKEAKAEYAKFQ